MYRRLTRNEYGRVGGRDGSSGGFPRERRFIDFAEQWVPPSPYDPKEHQQPHQLGRTYLKSAFHKWSWKNHPAESVIPKP